MPAAPHLRYETPDGCTTTFVGQWDEDQQRVVYDAMYTNVERNGVVLRHGETIEGSKVTLLLSEFRAWQAMNPPKPNESTVMLSEERLHKDANGELQSTYVEPYRVFTSTTKDDEGRTLLSPAHRCDMAVGELKPLNIPIKMAQNHQITTQNAMT